MASEIKIHLATYLKDAGIKATQQQIDQLSKKVVRANKEAQRSTQDFGGELGHIEGPLGKFQKAIGGAVGSALSFVAAFKVGWDIGTWLNEHVIEPLFGIKDPIEELKKQNRAIAAEQKRTMEVYEEGIAKIQSFWDGQVAGAEKAKAAIEDATQAYLKMQAAQGKVIAATDDAKLLGMQRDKFNAVAGASSPEEATAAGKYHDVLIAEEQAKQKLAEFDRKQEQAEVKLLADEQAKNEAVNKRVALKRELKDIDGKLAYAQSQQSVQDLGMEGSGKLEEGLLKKRAEIEKGIDAANREIDKRKADIAAGQVSLSAAPQERENMQARASLELDEKKKAYDDYCAYVEQQQAQQALDDWQRQQAEITRQVAEEKAQRMRMEQELAQQRIADLRTELTEQQQMQNAAQSRQGAAESKLTQAWSWYRNQGSMQAVIDEKKAQADAEVQWQKDFEKLKFRRTDWRTAEFGSLSAADESVRQVALAKEEKDAADKAVIETAENTRNLAQKLDELLSVKG